MSTETKAVETKVDVAVSQPKQEEAPITNPQEVDYDALLAEKDAELEKVRKEKENYKRGMLKAKGKLPEEDDNSSNEEDLDAKIERKVQERLLTSREAQVISEKEALIKAITKKNKELTLALKNRDQVSQTSGQGSNQEKSEGKVDNILSNEQLNALKAKGWDDKKIEAFKLNLTKVNQLPK